MEENPYSGFAEVYDEFMDNVPYDIWAERYSQILQSHGIDDGLVCDLACGTGNMTFRLMQRGYDMIGIDLSDRMLDLARKKDPEGKILFLQQDMCEFELYGTVRAVTMACDSINYLLSEEQVEEVFRLVNNYLDPGGIFLFDFNTREKYETGIGSVTIAENRENSSFIWDNYFDSESGINECNLTVFLKKEESGLFERMQETHIQKGYDPETIRRLLEKAGLLFLSAMTMEELGIEDDPGRYLVVAKEQMKEPL
ncbi:MAG: class I SAM-dependent methyltransferase [Lachnospiraceae bacterium]|nr:class I SAM-dependent methyltransferase [Lachnospiraceae bacterium]